MKTEIKFIGLNDGPSVEWPHFQWLVTINQISFEYRTGLGHRTDFFQGVRRMGQGEYGHGYTRNKRPANSVKIESAKCYAHTPTIESVLECLFLDADAGSESFNDFCDNLGYSKDSIKALDTYRACMDTKEKLRKALGADYANQKKLAKEGQSA